MLSANDVMKHPITVTPNTTIEEAVELLLNNNISGLPVTDLQDQLVGIISEFALLTVTYDLKSCGEPVSQHMTADVVTVAPDTSLTEIADIFILHRLRRLPVVENSRLVGIISRRDLLRAAVHSDQSIAAR